MRNLILTFCGICFYFFASSQDYGIHFQHGLTWQQVLTKARKEHKFVFVDCYTTWCGPCKFMAKNIFPLKETGDAINPKFVSVGMQLDSTKFDSDAVKLAYSDAHLFATRYYVHIYPTYLFFNPDGKLLHKAVGSTDDAAHFIAYAMDAIDPGRQYFSMIEKYRQGDRDTLLLEPLGQQAYNNDDELLADSILKDWFSAVRDLYKKDRLELIGQWIRKTDDPGFDLFFRNSKKIDLIVRPGFAENLVMQTIIRQEPLITGLLFGNSVATNWDKIGSDIKSKYGSDYSQRIIAWTKIAYYKNHKNWDLYGKSLVVYLKKYGNDLQAPELNNYLWDIFEYCSSPDDLAFALSCSKRVIINEKPDPSFIDTYANLLYKTGKKAEAIAKETEAVNLSVPSERKYYQDTLNKMKSGQDTWD